MTIHESPDPTEPQDRIHDMMERLLQDAGLTEGMHVLDVGCGRGDVTIMIAQRVGKSGRVLGFDRDENAVAHARTQALELGLANVAFCVADLLAPPTAEAPYDAVVGRRVLMYQPDRVAALKALAKVLKPGGVAVFQEIDGTMVPTSTRSHPLHAQVSRWLAETIKREGATLSMGVELPVAFEAAGLHVAHVRAEGVVQTATQRHITGTIMQIMTPRIVRAGVATEAEIEIDTLDKRLAEELRQAKSALVSDMVFGAWARKPT